LIVNKRAQLLALLDGEIGTMDTGVSGSPQGGMASFGAKETALSMGDASVEKASDDVTSRREYEKLPALLMKRADQQDPVNIRKLGPGLVVKGYKPVRALPGKPKKGKGRKGGAGSVIGIPLSAVLCPCPLSPPSFEASPTYRTKRRWISNANVAISNLNVSKQMMHGQFLVVVNNAGLALSYADMWRIRKITVWVVGVIEHMATVELLPVLGNTLNDGFVSREQVFSCSSTSESIPGKMSIKPSPMSALGAWYETSTVGATDPMFTINVKQGNGTTSGQWDNVTLDIDYEWVCNVTGVANGYTTTVTTLTVGSIGGRNISVVGNEFVLQFVNNLG
jgi:hypothetical protein